MFLALQLISIKCTLNKTVNTQNPETDSYIDIHLKLI